MLNKEGDVFTRHQFLNEKNTSLSFNFISVFYCYLSCNKLRCFLFFFPFVMSPYPALFFFFLTLSFILLPLCIHPSALLSLIFFNLHFPYCLHLIPNVFFLPLVYLPVLQLFFIPSSLHSFPLIAVFCFVLFPNPYEYCIRPHSLQVPVLQWNQRGRGGEWW